MGADPSAIAGNSAPQCLSTYKYINGLYLVSFLQYLLAAAPEHDEANNRTIWAALTTGSAASDFAGSAKYSRHGHVPSQGVTTMGRRANKHILITGGNSGIGLAAAQEFDREGARVAICGLNERTLQATKQTLGAGSLAVRADVSNLPDLDTLFATIKREFGHLDGVFVNAGYSEFLLFEEVTEQSFDKVIAVNFKGAYFTIQKALPLLRRGSSVIINASVGAHKGWPTTSLESSAPNSWTAGFA